MPKYDISRLYHLKCTLALKSLSRLLKVNILDTHQPPHVLKAKYFTEINLQSSVLLYTNRSGCESVPF